MELEGVRIGYAICGSFCTFEKSFAALRELAKTGAEIVPIMSMAAAATDTRFGKAEEFIGMAKAITGHDIIMTVKEAEPIGPKKLLDLLIVAPCTGNSLAKIASGIADTAVTMAVKSHLRNERPVLIGISTNDGLGTAAKNIGILMNRKNIYLIPFTQDDCVKKPNSLIAKFDKLIPAAEAALDARQLQPVIG